MTVTSEFFQPNRSYTDGVAYQAPEFTAIFDVELVTRNPDRHHLLAVGWMRTAEPGSKPHLATLDENEYRRGIWKPYVDTTTLFGNPAGDATGPVLLVCTYGWACRCAKVPALIVYCDGPDPTAARQGADDAAWAFARAMDGAVDQEFPAQHSCFRPRPQRMSVLRTAYASAPRLETESGNGEHTILRVHAQRDDEEPA
ncbi:hypothetical protein [Streptomyces niveus]|uniref:hypothetical protein n=1 Tax=Streptomyces niveus TaxID=193462 RepID=UPI00341B2B9E